MHQQVRNKLAVMSILVSCLIFGLAPSFGLEMTGGSVRWESLIRQAIEKKFAGEIEKALELAKAAEIEASSGEMSDLNSTAYGFSMFLLGDLYRLHGQFDLSEPLLVKAIEVIRKDVDAPPNQKWQNLGLAIRALVELYTVTDRVSLVEPYLKELTNPPKYVKPRPLETANNLLRLADYYLGTDQFDKAEQRFTEMLSVAKGLENQEMIGGISANGYNGLAVVSFSKKEYSAAEQYLESALESLKDVRPKLAREARSISLHIRGLIKEVRGFYSEAEQDFREALQYQEHIQSYGPHHLDIISSLANLYALTGRKEEAVRVLQETLVEVESRFGRNHILYARFASSLSAVLTSRDQISESKTLAMNALEGATESSDKAIALNNLAVALYKEGKVKESLEKLKLAWSILQDYDDSGPSVAPSLVAGNLGERYRELGDYKKARSYLDYALDHNRKRSPTGGLFTTVLLSNLGNLEEDLAKFEEELRYREQATGLIEELLLIQSTKLDQTIRDSIQKKSKGKFVKHIDVLFQLKGQEDSLESYARSVELFQLANWSGVDDAVWSMALRKASSDKDLAVLIRDAHDKARELDTEKARLDAKLALGKSALLHDREGSIFYKFNEAERALQALLRRIDRQSPGLATLRPNNIVGAKEIQELLKEGEALMMTLPSWSDRHGHLVWLIKKDSQIRYSVLPPTASKVLKDSPAYLSGLRDGDVLLRIEEHEIDTFNNVVWFTRRSPNLSLEFKVFRDGEFLELTITPKPVEDSKGVIIGRAGIVSYKGVRFLAELLRKSLRPTSPDTTRAFVPQLAYSLYKTLFLPADSFLDDVDHLIVVSNGPLESIPFHLLVTEDPGDLAIPAPIFNKQRGFSVTNKSENRNAQMDAFKEIAWLAKRFSITTLPSVSSLRALRTVAQKSEAPNPLIGFGNPKLNEDIILDEDLQVASLFRGARADVERVRQLPSLPETEQELKDLAAYLGAHKGALFLQDEATETNLKNTALDQNRVVAFATHGLVSGEIEGLAEPALVLTPPEIPTEQDDGLLTASEIAQLELDADLVILSACNTAAGKEVGAKGLSGLAKSFFYAGTRSLLVSHWPVESNAAAQLTTGMFERLKENPLMGKAKALQDSMMLLASDPKTAHPFFWAPFVLVGDGS